MTGILVRNRETHGNTQEQYHATVEAEIGGCVHKPRTEGHYQKPEETRKHHSLEPSEGLPILDFDLALEL